MTMDGWDFMIAGDDAEVAAEIAADHTAYVNGDNSVRLVIKQKYGLLGLSPQQVSECLAEMAKP